MPIFEYAPDCGACDQCNGRFEVFQKPHLRSLHLKHCPTCGKACHRLVSSFASPKSDKDLLSDTNVGGQGFVKYKRVGAGEYEKVTAGPGPRVINEGLLDKAGSNKKS